MNVLDLGCGTGSATLAFRSHGHRVIGVDWAHSSADIVGDWTKENTWSKIDAEGPYDFVWFSPDCGIFSVAGFQNGHFCPETYEPQTQRAISECYGIRYVLRKILRMRPTYGFIMENPRALMRKMDFVENLQRVTVTYCQYGDTRMKPTDLFGDIPQSFVPKSCQNGATCHTPAPRGSKTGTQGLTKEDAARIPFGLSLAIYESILVSGGETFPTLEDYA